MENDGPGNGGEFGIRYTGLYVPPLGGEPKRPARVNPKTMNQINAAFSSIRGLPNWFIALWCVLMPLTSVLLIPSVQGTIPAYVLAFTSVFFVILSRNDGQPS